MAGAAPQYNYVMALYTNFDWMLILYIICIIIIIVSLYETDILGMKQILTHKIDSKQLYKSICISS